MSVERCILCGEEIPEGQQCCPSCRMKVINMENRKHGMRSRRDQRIDQAHRFEEMESKEPSKEASRRFKRPAYYGIKNLLQHQGEQIFHEHEQE